jgi:hypothetical protein
MKLTMTVVAEIVEWIALKHYNDATENLSAAGEHSEESRRSHRECTYVPLPLLLTAAAVRLH